MRKLKTVAITGGVLALCGFGGCMVSILFLSADMFVFGSFVAITIVGLVLAIPSIIMYTHYGDKIVQTGQG